MLYKPLGFWTGFIAGFSATLIHILGDIFTYMEFSPLWPISKKRIALKWFRSRDPIANDLMWFLGSMTFLFYILFIYTNAGYVLIEVIQRIVKVLQKPRP